MLVAKYARVFSLFVTHQPQTSEIFTETCGRPTQTSATMSIRIKQYAYFFKWDFKMLFF